MPENARSNPTRTRLLEEATRLFAERGYRATSVAEICRAAKANVAAVNYYFGGKEKLYDAAWRRAFEKAEALAPLDAASPGTSLEEQLFRFVLAILRRTFDDGAGGWFSKLLYREMADPTIALERIADEVFEPQTKRLRRLLTKTRPEADPEVVLRCIHSVIAQCAFYNFGRALRARVTGHDRPSPEEIEALARHVARFSAAGIEATLNRTAPSPGLQSP